MPNRTVERNFIVPRFGRRGETPVGWGYFGGTLVSEFIPPHPPVGQRDLTPKEKKPRSGLRKSRTPRPITSAQMTALEQAVMSRDGRCVMIDHTESMCDGKTDAHHIVGQRVISAHFPDGHAAFRDERNVVALCRHHHNLIERALLRLPDETLPPGFDAFLDVYGFRIDYEAANARRT